MEPKPRVLVGLTGSVATVKWTELVLSLSSFAEVRVVSTRSAAHFQRISEAYNRTAWEQLHSGAGGATAVPCFTDEDEWRSYDNVHGDVVLHIELRKWADLILIAPLSANTLAKLSHGLCDNLLTSIARAWDARKPFLVAPAMNTEMWHHPFTDPQLATLRSPLGVAVIPPVSRLLACGDVGTGAMASVADIVEAVRARLQAAPPAASAPSSCGAGAAGQPHTHQR